MKRSTMRHGEQRFPRRRLPRSIPRWFVAGAAVAAQAFGATWAAPAPGLLAGPPWSQDEVPDKREDVKEWTSTLVELAKHGGEDDEEAVAIIDTLMQQWEGLGPKDKQLVVKSLDRCFKEKRRPLDDGSFENRIFIAAAVALGEMGGEDAAGVLADWIGHKLHEDDKDLQRMLVLSLGRTGEESELDELLKLLKDADPLMQAWSAEALSGFEEAPSDVRKKIFETMLKQLVPLYNDVKANPGIDPALRDRLDTISGPMISTLRQVSGCEERDPNEFQRFWNKNKKVDWDA